IGGSGLYHLPGLVEAAERIVSTPFGEPSAPIITGTLGSTPVAFLTRHGRGHRHSPQSVPYAANIHALRSLGVSHLLSISAVGSLRDDLPPRTAVLPDQIINRADSRVQSFFSNGLVAHVGLAEPFCPELRNVMQGILADAGIAAINGGTYVCIEGPQFSTRAESHLYRSWGASVIGMTAMPEAQLAREAGMCLAMLAMVTDYDVWHESEAPVTVEMVQRVLQDNVEVGRTAIAGLAESGLPVCHSGCREALEGAVITDPSFRSDAANSLLSSLSWSDPQRPARE
ncbi:MAG TPA: S-methyl-5'-thioadenosine phosphorylase, partial [Thermomicrobiales bacterium]|nr:S-methyl-5'-thioadenosine phosphorylase [Thermomicrobiales bacterium]